MAPPLLLSLGLLFLMPVLGDGPFWTDIMGTEIELCERAWWSNLLFINNFWQSKEMVNNHHHVSNTSALLCSSKGKERNDN